jgi:hypothetical protein
MERKDYTLRVYKKDRRTKSGELHVGDYDYKNKTSKWMSEEMRDLACGLYPPQKYRLELVETYVTQVNLVSGELFQERFDTPYYCSASSESFWSN